ncbi:TetR/AcrR family transcriptional regulator [Ilyobacter polytropus]|uniref:Transcriptional regulator, TetR family n=1 Tax=Ilyobacter polytropus (strain ATCC 51220 / DSM 2926 / LMG 16218 / CuHBu1) TaxID=572544 RepID=E3H8J7_ILYPC|nr:TetR/AcrR family transcriptional regulator [Ilyobacter polytropus]ADO82979.1 transcriptional regulator, TetR family [Ilyobacter polytropus DSM 2926]
MQVKKESVYKDIYNSALNEFWKNGYEKTTMRSIAESSGITLGNIYRYFPNKASLFETIIGSTYVNFLNIFDSYHNKLSKMTHEQKLSFYVELISNFLIYNKKKLAILFAGSKGTKFEDFEQKIIENFKNISIKRAEILNTEEGIVIEDQEIHSFIAESLFFSLKKIAFIFEEEEKIRKYLTKIIPGSYTDLLRKMGSKSSD